MPKITWPTLSNSNYRQFIGELRVAMLDVLNHLNRNNRGSLADVAATFRTVLNDYDAGNGNHLVYKSGTAITGVTPSGSYTTSVTLTVNSAGAVTAIVLA